ncbi:phage minor head protein [Streptomyces afghaniensis]|uniref:phage minor head protein n=1 Tax=Streptomyces afghaniensis TaxID=66865 RepID=UPI0027878820|nr:phage minor head protein [Streptomyces afghaniensis]MDQ1018949.1 2'-5' RNA ligase [Streptomyces afghaniensis]
MDEELLALLEQVEEDLAEEVAAVLAEAAEEFADSLAQADEIVAARFSVSRIASMFTARMPRIVRRLLRISEQAAEHTAEAVDAELPPEWQDLPERHDDGRALPPAMAEYVTVTEHLLRAVGDRLADVARDELTAGVDAGETMEQLRARLREAFAREGAQLGDAREERIARTESGRAWNTATLGAARDVTGPDRPVVKQWISRRDDRVREDHADANGQIQLLDEPFTVGGVQMDAPHDPTAPASQCVNCRCVLAVYPETRASAFETQDSPRSGALESTAAANGSHLMGGMIALMPTAEDAARLALDGGEVPEELHLTLYFLGDDGGAWTEDQRNELIGNVRAAVAELPGPLTANAFGVNHWNPNSDSPSWVWAVGDDRDRPDGAPTLEDVRRLVTTALEDTHERPELPMQHSPWAPHVCAQYSDDHGLLPVLVDRLGPITFDRVRLAFAGDHTDIPLGPQQEEEAMPTEDVQAAAEVAQDFIPLTVRGWSTPEPWAIAYEDEETGDGRIFSKGALKWDRQPKALQHADEMLMGHQGARLAGAIQKVKREGSRITASGVLYLNQPAGLDAVLLLDEDAPLGISVDLDDVDVEFVDKTLSPEDAEWLFASAHLPQASLMRMEDGSVMLSASTSAEWTASGGSLSRSRYDLQLITGPNGAVAASALTQAFAGAGVVTAAAGDADDTETGLVIHSQKSGEFLLRITRARLRGATLVAMPAFKDAKIVLDPVDQSAAAVQPPITAAGETRERVITYVCTSPAAVGARDVSGAIGIAMSTARGHLNAAAKDGRIIRLAPGLFCGPSSMPEGHEEVTAAMSGKHDLPVHDQPDAEWDGDKASSRVLAWATDDKGNVDAEKLGSAFNEDEETASLGLPPEIEASAWTAMQQMPPMPAEWFREPTEEELPDGSGGVHYKDGRVYGWVATIDEPHVGYPGKNLTVRKLAAQGLDFTHFLRAKGQLDDGTTVPIGAMTMNVGHHRDGAECETAACQFDDTRTVGAIVTVGLNDRGLWFSGASAPWLSEWDRAVFAACQPSYHLRQGRDGTWQLRAVLTVPVPGHSTPMVAAIHAVAERSQLALAASAAGLIPLADNESGHDQDAVRTPSASSTDTTADPPGQHPDTASGQRPGAAPVPVPEVDVEALAAALANGPLVDLLTDAVTRRQDQRRAEVEAMAALVAAAPVALTASAASNGVN